MTHAAKLRMIRDYYGRLAVAAPGDEFSKLERTITSEERGHRRMGTRFNYTYARGLTIRDGVRLWAVRRILGYRCGDKEPDPRYACRTPYSVYIGWSLWVLHKKAIARAFPIDDARRFLEDIEYGDLITGASGDK